MDEAITDLLRQLDPAGKAAAYRKLLAAGAGRPVVMIDGENCSVVHAAEIESLADGTDFQLCEGSDMAVTVDAELKRFAADVKDDVTGVIMVEGDTVTTKFFSVVLEGEGEGEGGAAPTSM
jgi:hypothetical protein